MIENDLEKLGWEKHPTIEGEWNHPSGLRLNHYCYADDTDEWCLHGRGNAEISRDKHLRVVTRRGVYYLREQVAAVDSLAILEVLNEEGNP